MDPEKYHAKCMKSIAKNITFYDEIHVHRKLFVGSLGKGNGRMIAGIQASFQGHEIL